MKRLYSWTLFISLAFLHTQCMTAKEVVELTYQPPAHLFESDEVLLDTVEQDSTKVAQPIKTNNRLRWYERQYNRELRRKHPVKRDVPQNPIRF